MSNSNLPWHAYMMLKKDTVRGLIIKVFLIKHFFFWKYMLFPACFFFFFHLTKIQALLVWQDGWVHEGDCHQPWRPVFNPCNPCGGKTELTPSSCLACMCSLTPLPPHAHEHEMNEQTMFKRIENSSRGNFTNDETWSYLGWKIQNFRKKLAFK